jgi:hypothetical protein
LNLHRSFQQTADPSNYAAEPIVKYHLILSFCNILHEFGDVNKREPGGGKIDASRFFTNARLCTEGWENLF